MTTIVNNPPPTKDSGGSIALIIGCIALIVVAYLFFVYGLPAIKQMLPGTPQINIPDKIDVNINQQK